MDNDNLIIGHFDPKAKYFKREYFRQGYIYKNYPAYKENDKVCYIPELSGYLYTR